MKRKLEIDTTNDDLLYPKLTANPIAFDITDYAEFLNGISSSNSSLSNQIKIELDQCLQSFNSQKESLPWQENYKLSRIIEKLEAIKIERDQLVTDTNQALNEYWHDREIGTIEIEIANNYKKMIDLAQSLLSLIGQCLNILPPSIFLATIDYSSASNQSDTTITPESSMSPFIGYAAIGHGASDNAAMS